MKVYQERECVNCSGRVKRAIHSEDMKAEQEVFYSR